MSKIPKFLLDENLSPLTVKLLKNLGFDAVRITDHHDYSREDEKIAEIASKERRILLTTDLDFGEIYHFSEFESYGVWILRLTDLTVESVNKRLKQFLKSRIFSKLEQRSLVVLEDFRERVRLEAN